MKSLRQKIASYITPWATSALLMAGGIARAEIDGQTKPNHAPMVQQVQHSPIHEQDFRGKSFDERMLKAEEIVQRYNIENKTEFSNIFEVLLKEAPSHPANLSPKLEDFLMSKKYQAFDDVVTINDDLELIHLGCLRREIEADGYPQQLRVCGMDMLADFVENKVDMSKLSDADKVKLFAQYEVESLFFDVPPLTKQLIEQSGYENYPIERGPEIVNGHKWERENPYFVTIIKQVQNKLAKEKVDKETLKKRCEGQNE